MLSQLLVAALLALGPQTAGPKLSLPPSAAAAFLQEDTAEAPELPSQQGVPDWSSPAWRTPGPWDAWAQALATPDVPASRLHLMLNARALGRSEEAWEHFAHLPRAWAEGLITELLLAPAERDGVLTLRPLLPPVPAFDPATTPGLPPKRLYTASGLVVAETTLGLVVEVAPEGVEVRLAWEAGPPLDVRVMIPTPDDWRARLVYSDWDRADLEPDGYPVRLAPPKPDEEAEHILWARCEAERRTWPRLGQARFQGYDSALTLVTKPNDPELERLRQAARFLGKALELDVKLDTKGGSPLPSAEGRTPLLIRLAPGESRDLKLRDLVTQAERVAIGRRVVEFPMPR